MAKKFIIPALGALIAVLVLGGEIWYINVLRGGAATLPTPTGVGTPPAAGPTPANNAPISRECQRTGCSGQICSDEEVITTCEWTPKYACYAGARCERQSNGQCGWTETPGLKACLQNPPEEILPEPW